MTNNKRGMAVALLAAVMILGSGKKPDDTGKEFLIRILPGPGWIHAFNLFIKNPPQYALWIEDESGRYRETVFVTGKIAKRGWIASKGNPRVEALPVWMHRRNIRGSDGLLQPSKKEPVTDGMSGATPRGGQELAFNPPEGLTRFWLYLEINHSTDFNDTWPENATQGEPGWSGGREGSGQPSLVYRVLIDTGNSGPWQLEPVGHGSPDGSDGFVYPDLSKLTTAKGIIESVSVMKVRE